MSTGDLRELRRRARALGVQTEFTDSTGRRCAASVETLRAIAELIGDTGRTPDPVQIAWNGVLNEKPPRGAAIHCEEGAEVQIRNGVMKLPFGYHRLVSGHRTTLIISAPNKAYAPSAVRLSGVFVPMYALHSKTSWGAGNLTDWHRLSTSLPPKSVVATLPLMGAFLEKWKCEPSPYSPATRLFWNEFCLDVTRVPEFSASEGACRLVNSTAFQRQLTALRQSGVVDYEREMALKRRVFEQLATEFFHKPSPRRRDFESFVKQRSELDRYAAFRAVCEQRCKPWHAWPARLREGRLRDGDYDKLVKRYFLFAQWLAQEQMEQLLAAFSDRGVKLYLDMPLGVNPDGYDVWANQNLFVSNASVGAPPDAFFTKGQDWGFPPLHPQRIRGENYRYVVDYLRFQMRHTGMLRLDHVMGLHRLWWVPRGASAADGVYVIYNAKELYAILCLESHRHQTMLVGENLGTVPPEVNRSMKRHGLRSMFVAQYELQPDPKRALRNPPRDCVASINTHDMPMWAAFWRGLDIADRQQLGLLGAAEVRLEKKRRAQLRKALVKFLRRKPPGRRGPAAAPCLAGPATTRNVLWALLKFLARSDAEVVLANLEDFWLETEPQNTPGTSTERVNWKRKTKLSLDECLAHADVSALLDALDRKA